MDTLKQFAENEKKQRIEAEKELHLQVRVVCCGCIKQTLNEKNIFVRVFR